MRAFFILCNNNTNKDIIMEKKKRDDKKPKQRFSKDKYGEFIRKNYATRKTAELSRYWDWKRSR